MSQDGSWSMNVREAIAPAIPAGTPDFYVDAAVKQAESTILATIVHSWPVDTGLSLAGFHVDGDMLENNVEYTEFVHDDLVERLAADGLVLAFSEVSKTLADIEARASTKPGERIIGKSRVGAALGQTNSPNKAVSLLNQGKTAEAVAAFREGLAAERLTGFLGTLGLPPGTVSAARSLAAAGRLNEAVMFLQKAGRMVEAQALRNFARTL